MASLRPREIKTLAPLCSNLQTWEFGLFDSKDWALFTATCHSLPIWKIQGQQTQYTVVRTYGLIGLLQRGSKGRGKRLASGVGTHLLK